MPRVKVRFAPSPTGPLHIGGARSALFNWLYARHTGGSFLVRMEDTDRERSSRESEENILAALRWLGLDWDEGIGAGGPNGPYRQTERLDIYRGYAQQMLDAGLAYHCYCTEEELTAEREALLAKGEMPRYLGRCRNLSPQERARCEAAGRRPVLRFKVPAGQTVVVHDQVRGAVSFDCDGIGDFIIMKSDGIPTYNFAVVVDDHLMGITHVIRAEEHLPNTPRQILLYRALGWPEPEFAHVSLILGADRTKMSKRHGATSIEQYQELGYLPEALVNFLALLGWSPGGEDEVFSPEQLKELFTLDRVAKSPAVFDLEKLNWLNGHYIRQCPLERITDLAIPFLQKAGYITGEITPERYARLKSLVAAVRDYLSNLAEITQHVDIFFAQETPPVDDEARAVLTGEQVPAVLAALREKMVALNELDEETARMILKKLPRELGLGGKKVYMPLRVALTGRTHGPELYQVLPLLGPEKVAGRLARAAGRCS
ncbi:glutamate--tRNA ligase [Desulfotomaculum copahuensis]|uniref:glutamate--tRNA ligase n=1 Tax=Desulfotomaculum copahuensis TaxID=1838280 RepID=UPI000B0F585F|nr:glutamate--tRNA ligase [Desulfotomaculum copahuensis]